MAQGFLVPVGPLLQILSDQGVVGLGFKINTYVGGSVSTPLTTYTDATLVTPNSNPIIMGSNGRFQSVNIWVPSGTLTKLVLQDASNNIIAGGTIDNVPALNDITASTIGLIFYPQTPAELAAGITPIAFNYPPGTPNRYLTNTTPGVTDMTAALNFANSSWNGGGGVCNFLAQTYLATSTVTLPFAVTWLGQGVSDKQGVGSGNRGPTCILRGFAGNNPMVILGGDCSGVDQLDFDGNLQGSNSSASASPDNVVVVGSRCRIGRISTRNSANDGLRIGMSTGWTSAVYPVNAGSNNTNLWHIGSLTTYNNKGHGLRVDDTNTNTSTNFPLGLNNVDGGWCSQLDAYSNGLDGLHLGNSMDNGFGHVTSQVSGQSVTLAGAPLSGATSATLSANWPLPTGVYTVTFTETVGGALEYRYATLTQGATTMTWATGLGANCNASFVTGYGIHFRTDGTNTGPRVNKILGHDSEQNTGQDILIDAATLPASNPGLYNYVFGTHGAAVTSRIVDNSTGSFVLQWSPSLPFRAYHFGTDANVINPAAAGQAGWNLAVGANLSPARVYAVPSGAADSILRAQVHKTGGVLTDGWELNNNLVFRSFGDLTSTSGAALTPDCTTGLWFDHTTGANGTITVNAPINGITGQFIEITMRNTSGGALTVNFNAVYKQSGALAPANGNSRTIRFRNDGANWIEQWRSGADVPN